MGGYSWHASTEGDPEHILPLSKQQVAHAHIDGAIGLFFARFGDAPIHVLASAAQEVTSKVGDSRGELTYTSVLRRAAFDVGKAEGMKLSEAYSFMKHADRDPHGTLDGFKPMYAHATLFMAVSDYVTVFKHASSPMAIYWAWFWSAAPVGLGSGKLGQMFDQLTELMNAAGGADRFYQQYHRDPKVGEMFTAYHQNVAADMRELLGQGKP